MPFLQRDLRIHRVPAVGLAAAPLLGVLFGLGWTPCIGPTLTAVQALAMNEGTAGRGALLSLAYSLGLGMPFLVAGLAFRRMLGAVRLGPPAPAVGDPARRDDADLRGAAAGDRPVGPLGRRPAQSLVAGFVVPVTADRDDRRAPTSGPRRGRRVREPPPTPPSSPPALSPVELSRWAWRQLTSMRTALVLLFLLALAAVPGSVVPQQNIDAVKVSNWKAAHPS